MKELTPRINKLFQSIALGILFIMLEACYYSDNNSINENAVLSLISTKRIQVVFVGDSLAERSNTFQLQSKLGNAFNIIDISQSGWDVPRWLLNLDRILESNPEILILGLGTNDANNYSTELFPLRYSQFVNELQNIRPISRIFHTLPPPTASPILRERIRLNNEWLKTEYDPKVRVDIFELFNQFELSSSVPLYPLSDPIHPNPIGYELMGEEYKSVIINSYR